MLKNHFISQAVILCGGYGTRVEKITKNKIPKSLLIVNNKPFIYFLLKQISDLKIKRVIFCIGFLGDAISNEIKEIERQNKFNLEYIFSYEKSPLGTAGALRLAKNKLLGKNSIVFNGDTFVETNLNKFIEWHFKYDNDISLCANYKFISNRYGVLKIKNNKLNSIQKKRFSFFSYVYSGVFICKNDILNLIEKNKFINVEEALFESNNNKISVWRNKGKFIDIGTEKSYLNSKRFFN